MREQAPLGFKIKQINNIYEKEINNLLKKLGLTSSQCAVLDFLFNSSADEVNQRDVEKALSLKNPTVTGILKRMEENGFVFMAPSVKDKRCKNIYLTEKAYAVQKKMVADRKKIDKKLTLGMNKKEIEGFHRLLDKALYSIIEP